MASFWVCGLVRQSIIVEKAQSAHIEASKQSSRKRSGQDASQRLAPQSRTNATSLGPSTRDICALSSSEERCPPGRALLEQVRGHLGSRISQSLICTGESVDYRS